MSLDGQGETRASDRLIRAEIDPLLSGLSPLGKFELAVRLMGEFVGVGGAARALTARSQPSYQLAAVPPIVIEGTAGEERDSAAAEAGNADGAAAHHTDNDTEGN